MEDSFRNPADLVGGGKFVADFGGRCELPGGVVIQRIHVESAFQEEAGFLGKFLQRVLESVVDLCEQAGTQFHAQKRIGEFNAVAHFESGGAFEDLEVGAGAAHPDDFAFESAVADKHIGDFVLCDAGVELNGQKVAVDADNPAHFLVFEHKILSPFSKLRYRKAVRRLLCGPPPRRDQDSSATVPHLSPSISAAVPASACMHRER